LPDPSGITQGKHDKRLAQLPGITRFQPSPLWVKLCVYTDIPMPDLPFVDTHLTVFNLLFPSTMSDSGSQKRI
jgi:hypothetical protein